MNNYPMGAENDPRSPWNEETIPEKEFNITISQTLSKDTRVWTDKYNYEGGYLDKEDGGYYVEELTTNEVPWKQEYEKQHYTPIQLIGILKQICKDILNGDKKGYKCEELIQECSGWVEDETEVIKE